MYVLTVFFNHQIIYFYSKDVSPVFPFSVCRSVLYSRVINHLSVTCFLSIIPYSTICLLTLFMVDFLREECLVTSINHSL